MINLLIRFSREVANKTSGEIMPALVEAAVEYVGVSAAAVVQIDGEHARVVAASHLPASLLGVDLEADAVESSLARTLCDLSGGRFRDARMLPLVSGSDLYGALILFGEEKLTLEPGRFELASALADLAAISIARAVQYAQLARSYEELRASRDAMARSEKLRALGQMAAGVAHDLKNLLNPLALQLRVLEKRLDTDRDGARAAIASMKDVIHVGVETIERLTAFSRQKPERKLETLDLQVVARTATGLGRARLAQYRGIELVETLAPAPPIRARASELVNAIVNLILNATEAMAATGGTITVTTGTDGDGGYLTVADDGPGMPPEIERRVFEPFFTTKGEGTGLGLAMVYAFVQRQGGRMTLETAPGQGATFRLWFPAATPVKF